MVGLFVNGSNPTLLTDRDAMAAPSMGQRRRALSSFEARKSALLRVNAIAFIPEMTR
jgi:hypothetical protein